MGLLKGLTEGFMMPPCNSSFAVGHSTHKYVQWFSVAGELDVMLYYVSVTERLAWECNDVSEFCKKLDELRLRFREVCWRQVRAEVSGRRGTCSDSINWSKWLICELSDFRRIDKE